MDYWKKRNLFNVIKIFEIILDKNFWEIVEAKKGTIRALFFGLYLHYYQILILKNLIK